MNVIHPTAEVSPKSQVGSGTRIWNGVQIREGAVIGRNCIIGKGAYVDSYVTIGNNVKIQNSCCVYRGASLEDGVFLGPGVILTNDKLPRAINPDGSLKAESDWQLGQILIKRGASIGAGAIVLPDVVVGIFAMIAAGAVVTRNVPDYGLVVGAPARLVGFVCPCGGRLEAGQMEGEAMLATCSHCGKSTLVGRDSWESIRG